MITGAQIRAGRALLKWSAQHLADRAGLNGRTVERLERSEGIPPSRADTLIAIQRVLESEGVEFVGKDDEGPGVRRWPK